MFRYAFLIVPVLTMNVALPGMAPVSFASERDATATVLKSIQGRWFGTNRSANQKIDAGDWRIYEVHENAIQEFRPDGQPRGFKGEWTRLEIIDASKTPIKVDIISRIRPEPHVFDTIRSRGIMKVEQNRFVIHSRLVITGYTGIPLNSERPKFFEDVSDDIFVWEFQRDRPKTTQRKQPDKDESRVKAKRPPTKNAECPSRNPFE